MNKPFLVLFILFHFLSTYWVQKIGNSFYMDRNSRDGKYDVVWDITHEYLPNLHNYEPVTGLIIVLCLLPLLFNRTKAIHVITDLIYNFPFILFIRSITMLVTILPKHDNCISNKLSLYNFFNGHCYDKIFSGHTAFILLLTLSYFRHNIIANIPVLLLLNIINIMTILLTRSHYTIDVVISIFLTICVYNNCIFNPITI